jgi:hypothetical protein
MEVWIHSFQISAPHVDESSRRAPMSIEEQVVWNTCPVRTLWRGEKPHFFRLFKDAVNIGDCLVSNSRKCSVGHFERTFVTQLWFCH